MIFSASYQDKNRFRQRWKEAIALCLEVENEIPAATEFIGVQRVAV